MNKKNIKRIARTVFGTDDEGNLYFDPDTNKPKSMGRPKGLTKRTIDRYKKVYHRFIISQKKYPAMKKSELYELCSTSEYDGKSYTPNTVRNIIEDKKYNLIPSR